MASLKCYSGDLYQVRAEPGGLEPIRVSVSDKRCIDAAAYIYMSYIPNKLRLYGCKEQKLPKGQESHLFVGH